MKKVYPKVEIESMTLIESEYENKEGYVWSALKLIEASKDLPVFDYPLVCIDLSVLPFQVNNMKDLLFQMNRINNTDLKYPIILDDKGVIADGYHRVVKAIMEGHTFIKAIRLTEMPDADSIRKNDDG